MASVIEKGNNSPTSLGTTTVVTTSGGATTAGSTLLLVASIPFNSTSGPTPTDSAGNSYTFRDQGVHSDGFSIGVWECVNALALANGGTCTITYGGSINRRTAMLLELTGVATASANDKHVGTTSDHGAAAMNAVSTGALAQAAEIVLAFACAGSSFATSTVPGAWTKLTDIAADQGGTDLCQFGEYQIVAATTSITADQTQSVGQEYAQVIVSYKVSGSVNNNQSMAVTQGTTLITVRNAFKTLF